MPILEGASNVTISGCARLYEIHGDAVINQLTPDTKELKKIQSIVNLPRAQASRKDYKTKKKSGPCFPGTRKALLGEMIDWVTNRGESRMYALSGLAGIGKSTVVYTIATEANKLGLLGASFFFSRDEADRRTAKSFFTTIAHQLCLFNEQFAQAIAGALVKERGSTAITGSPKEQLEALILDPLHAIVTPNTPQTLIVVDALDECDDEDAPSVLSGLQQIIQALPSFKVILTTRTQPLVKNNFTSQDSHKIFHLQDIEDKVVNEDIRLYLKHSLSLEQVREQLQDPTEQWCASDGEIEILVGAAGKLFIIAATIVRFVLDKTWSDPADRMEELLHAFAQNRTPFDNLHEFYNIILRRAVPAGCRDTRVAQRYQAVVGIIMLSPVPLSVNTLAALTGVKKKQVFAVLRQLQSIILLGCDNIAVIYHKSFIDYITNSALCKDIDLLIDPRECHTLIAIRCFQLMQQHLKYNILGLSEPAQYMSNNDGLAKDGMTDEQLQEKIPEHLRYTCIYWANHLGVANLINADLVEELERFADRLMLPWFEVLSLIGQFDLAHRRILVALKVSKSTSADLRQLLSDGLRFIGKFYETIKQSALYTYHSALAFTPTDSILYHRYINGGICQVIGGPDTWNALVANLDHNKGALATRICNVQFSLDSTKLVSWSANVLETWDAAAGTPISTVRGSGFAIANNFSTIASFQDKTITLHNLVNGSEQGIIIQTQVKILQVAISSENSRIAAGLSGGTVCLWHSRNGELLGCFNDYKGHHLEFSATGTRLTYESVNRVVKLRDGIDGRPIANLDGRSHDLHFAFSRDGARIATSSDGELKLWSCDGKLVGVAEEAGVGDSEPVISTTGSFIATRCGDEIKLWSGDSGKHLSLIDALDLHPYSMVFSSNGTLAIGTHDDIKLYDIKSRSFVSTLSFPYAGALAFSPDCSRLAAGDRDGAIRLWDIDSVKASSLSSDEQASGRVTALALSRDCSRIACGKDGVIELWGIDGSAKYRIATHRDQGVIKLSFSTDDSRFGSMSHNGTIKLWEGKSGASLGALKRNITWIRPHTMEVSNSVLAVLGWEHCIALCDTKTLEHIHTFWGNFRNPLSFSADDAFLAAAAAIDGRASPQIIVFCVTQHTTIATFDVESRHWIRTMAFLPDNSQLVVQLDSRTDDSFSDFFDDNISYNDFLTFNLLNKVSLRPTIEDITQLLNLPLWNGVPVWARVERSGQCCLRALFSQHKPVDVLWIPREFHVGARIRGEGRFMIALGCKDGRVLLLRLPSTRVPRTFRSNVNGQLEYSRL